MNSLVPKEIGKHIDKESIEVFFKAAKERGYAFIDFEQAKDHTRFIIMRHDVDIHLEYAKQMAELEARNNVKSAYFFMLRNPLYNLLSPASVQYLERIIGFGHKVGLHFDVSAYSALSGPALLDAIGKEMTLLKGLVGASHVSKCVTFHKPSPYILSTEISTDEFFSGYNQSFFRDIRYIADSCGMWREESILDLIRLSPPPKIQFNCHPVWWFAPGRTQTEKLSAMLQDRAARAEDDLASAVNDPSRNSILYSPLSRPK